MKAIYMLDCETCGQNLEVEDDVLGTKVDCPACGKPMKIPNSYNRHPWSETVTGLEARLRDASDVVLILSIFATFGLIVAAIQMGLSIAAGSVILFSLLISSIGAWSLLRWMAEMLAVLKRAHGMGFEPRAMTEAGTRSGYSCGSCSSRFTGSSASGGRCPKCGVFLKS